LRWGSYLAVLLDRDKPVWSEVHSANTSRICDQEMARINIEASAALAEWIDLFRADPGGLLYEQFVNRAVCYLPMPKKTAKLKVTAFAALADPAMAELVVQASDAARLQRVRADAERFPSRIFANALVNTAWRNGPVEIIHGGEFRRYPLDQRRATPAEERDLMANCASGRDAAGEAGEAAHSSGGGATHSSRISRCVIAEGTSSSSKVTVVCRQNTIGIRRR
jgi:hypothetical protein